LKHEVILCRGLLAFFFAASVAACGQTPSPPFLNVLDLSADGSSNPLLLVQGGEAASTQGIEVTSQSLSTATGGGIMTPQPTGFGGITLLQTSAATATAVQGSPMFSICGQQLTGSGAGTSTAACWNWQVTGAAGLNGEDILSLTRTNPSSTTNTTLLGPSALNISTGFINGTGNHSGQLTIGALPSGDTDLSADLITVVGGFTTSNNTAAKGNALQLFPGWLSNPNTNAGALEGPLQIGMVVKGTGSSTTNSLLACYTSAQTAMPCGTAGVALTAPLLGVYSPLGCDVKTGTCSTGGSAAVVAPPSRAQVAQFSSTATTWSAGTPVCRDPASGHGSYALASATVACPIGQAVGVAVGDSGPLTVHSVDLDFAPQGTTSSGGSTTYATAAASLTMAPAGTVACSDGSGNITTSNCATVSTSGQGWTMLPTITYTPTANTATALVAGASNVRVLQVVIPTKIVIGHADMNVVGLSASSGQSMTFGLYDTTGTKVLDAGTFDCSAGGLTGAKQNAASATILPGVYYYAWGATATDCTTNSVPGATNVQTLLGLGGAKRYGTVTGATLTSGSLPMTITLTNISNTGTPLPVTLIEP
jgi:hypothetical protein